MPSRNPLQKCQALLGLWSSLPGKRTRPRRIPKDLPSDRVAFWRTLGRSTLERRANKNKVSSFIMTWNLYTSWQHVYFGMNDNWELLSCFLGRNVVDTYHPHTYDLGKWPPTRFLLFLLSLPILDTLQKHVSWLVPIDSIAKDSVIRLLIHSILLHMKH